MAKQILWVLGVIAIGYGILYYFIGQIALSHFLRGTGVPQLPIVLQALLGLLFLSGIAVAFVTIAQKLRIHEM